MTEVGAGQGGAAEAAPRRGPLAALIVELRPRQWTKNLIVFAALIFSANIDDSDRFLRSLAAFAIFCGLSGASYLINDLTDLERDRLHPKKCLRPLAAGEVGKGAALATAVAVATAALAGSFFLGWAFFATAVGFFALLLAYSFVLKELVIIDAMTIAAGFVLRVVAGALAIDVPISPWIILCTALLALFLALVKRRYELVTVEDPLAHRPTLEHYSEDFLDAMIATITAATIVAYSLYTFFTHDGVGTATGDGASAATVAHDPWMMVTIPFVAYGMFRYLYLVHLKGLGGSPEEILVSDVPLIVDIVLFVVVALAVLGLQG
jgi:4-hydroxybenzoate polyprenyltransferase